MPARVLGHLGMECRRDSALRLSAALLISAAGTLAYLNSPRLLTTLSSGQKEALLSSTTISTLREVLPRPVETTHSHSPLASTWTLNRISSLVGEQTAETLVSVSYPRAGPRIS